MFALLLACSGAVPTSHVECAEIGSDASRDECYSQTLPLLFCSEPEAATKIVEEKVTSPSVRDFIWHRVTSTVDPYTDKYCKRIQDEKLAEACGKIPARPHMNRERTEGICPDDGQRQKPGMRAPPPPGAKPPG